MSAPTDLEQLYLELVNDARLNPQANAARYIASYTPLASNDRDIQDALDFFDVDGAALQAAFDALEPVQPLAWNDALAGAARAHSRLMLRQDQQSHRLPGEADLAGRIDAAGYAGWWSIAENVFAFSLSPVHGHAAFMVDWGAGPGTIDGMQSPAGHRDAIMNPSYREIGIGVLEDSNTANEVGPQLVTADFGARFHGPPVLVLGVAFDDRDGDAFYSIGEGIDGIRVRASTESTGSTGSTGSSDSTVSTVSTGSGGYTLGLDAGPHTIVYSGGSLVAPLTLATELDAGTSAKIDIVDGTTLRTSVSADVSGPVARIEALGATGVALSADDGDQTIVGSAAADWLDGAGGDDTLAGNAGDDTLLGGSGRDVAVYAGSRSGHTISRQGSVFVVTDDVGSDGTDTLEAIEAIEFADASFELQNLPRAGIPGYGQLADFLFDAVFYLLANPELVPAHSLASAWDHYRGVGAVQGLAPTSWFDPDYYENRWDDLRTAGFDHYTLFVHFNLYGVWEGRAPGPMFDRFDGDRYLAENADVAEYVDASIADFLGSRTNGAIAHYVIHGADESRQAYDLSGGPIDLGYVV
ncbi:MAG: hypothetical protein JSW68_13585 [Burkholderiales bacterium]|nr:MAG: hypothetical protein JSW68_13585 [Burkholderiales bacterium]